MNQELDAVQRIVANPPEEVPEQLLKALEKDAKNLQKSLSSANEILQSRLQNLRGAAEAEKVELGAAPLLPCKLPKILHFNHKFLFFRLKSWPTTRLCRAGCRSC